MHFTSIASAAPRNIESVRVNDMIPQAIQENAQLLVSFLEEYYKHLNSVGQPSAEIQGISSLNDLDLVSEKYLSQIESLIGKSVPNSSVIDKFELYKIVLQYYNTRGSEESIFLFFKIFLNKVVELSYPKEELFKLSEGDWDKDAEVYLDNKSFISDTNKLFDGYFYQDYSYVIRSDLDSSLWQDDYMRFVHPAGLKLFTAIVVEIVSLNKWNDFIDYYSISTSASDPGMWLNKLVPPHRFDKTSIAYHTPKYQPGFLRDQFFRYLFKYIFERGDEDLLRLTIINLKLTLISSEFRDTFVREQYLISEKFVDPTETGAGRLSNTIANAGDIHSRINRCKFLNIGTFVKKISVYEGPYLDYDGASDSGAWSMSYVDNSAQTQPVGWEQSAFEL